MLLKSENTLHTIKDNVGITTVASNSCTRRFVKAALPLIATSAPAETVRELEYVTIIMHNLAITARQIPRLRHRPNGMKLSPDHIPVIQEAPIAAPIYPPKSASLKSAIAFNLILLSRTPKSHPRFTAGLQTSSAFYFAWLDGAVLVY